MNCFNHPMETATATCQDCQKGLCQECATMYEMPICQNCNHHRVKTEKEDIIKDYMIILVVGAILCYGLHSLSGMGKKEVSFPIFMYYICFAAVAGWRFLNKKLPTFFLSLPIVGWVLFWTIKFILSYLIGIFVLPYKIVKDILRWRTLNQIQ